jgi:hypothetical protein
MMTLRRHEIYIRCECSLVSNHLRMLHANPQIQVARCKIVPGRPLSGINFWIHMMTGYTN